VEDFFPATYITNEFFSTPFIPQDSVDV